MPEMGVRAGVDELVVLFESDSSTPILSGVPTRPHGDRDAAPSQNDTCDREGKCLRDDAGAGHPSPCGRQRAAQNQEFRERGCRNGKRRIRGSPSCASSARRRPSRPQRQSTELGSDRPRSSIDYRGYLRRKLERSVNGIYFAVADRHYTDAGGIDSERLADGAGRGHVEIRRLAAGVAMVVAREAIFDVILLE